MQLRDQLGVCCRTEGTNVEAFALHPGVILTGLWQHTPVLKPFLKLAGCFFAKNPAQVRRLVDASSFSSRTPLRCVFLFTNFLPWCVTLMSQYVFLCKEPCSGMSGC